MSARTDIKYDTDGWLGTITISNPPENRLTRPDFEELEVLERFLATPGLKAVVVRGEGRHFCAGADLVLMRDQLSRDENGFARSMGIGKSLLEAITAAPVVTLAEIRGSCLGAGLEIALACHFRVASRNAMLGFPEVEHGFLPGLSGTVNAPTRVGRARAMDLILGGRMLRGEEAATIGLVDAAVPTSELEDAALGRLRALTGERSVDQVRAIVTAVNNALSLDAAQAQGEETRLFVELAKASLSRNGEER